MNTHTNDTFQKYERKRPSKHSLDSSLEHTLPDEHSERYNKGGCVKRGWRGIRENKRNWSGDVYCKA